MPIPARLSIRDDYPQVYTVGRAKTRRLAAYRAGELVAPEAGGTFSLLGPGGTAIVEDAAVTVDDDVAQVTVDGAALTSDLVRGGGYREVWGLTYDDHDHAAPIDIEAALAVRDLYPVVTDGDIDRRYPHAAQNKRNGTWQPYIDEAWRDLVRRLIDEGRHTFEIVSHTALKEPHLHRSLELIFRSLVASQGVQTRWSELADTHASDYERAWRRALLRVDTNHDGEADATGPASSPIHINVSPRRRLGPGW